MSYSITSGSNSALIESVASSTSAFSSPVKREQRAPFVLHVKTREEKVNTAFPAKYFLT